MKRIKKKKNPQIKKNILQIQFGSGNPNDIDEQITTLLVVVNELVPSNE